MDKTLKSANVNILMQDSAGRREYSQHYFDGIDVLCFKRYNRERMRLGEVLKKWRSTTNLGCREAASLVGISAATWSRIERGEAMDGNTLAALLRWLMEKV